MNAMHHACCLALLMTATAPRALASERIDLVAGGEMLEGTGWPMRPRITDIVTVTGKSAHLWSGRAGGSGAFRMHAKLELPVKSGTGAGLRLGSSIFGFDGPGGRCFSEGPFFLGTIDIVDASEKAVREGVPFELDVVRDGTWLEVTLNGERMYRAQIDSAPIGRIGLTAGTGELRVVDWWIEGDFTAWNPPESLWTVTDDRVDEYADPVLVAGAGGALHAFTTGVTTLEPGKDGYETFERVRDAAGAWSEPKSVLGAGIARVAAWSDAAGPRLVAIRRAADGAPRAIVVERTPSGWLEKPLAIEGVPDAEAGAVLAARLPARAGSTVDGRRVVPLASATDAAAQLGVMMLVEGDAGAPWRMASAGPFERIAFMTVPECTVALGVQGKAVAAVRRTAGAWGAPIAWSMPWNPSVTASMAAHGGRAELLSGAMRRETGLKRAVLDAGAAAWRDAPNDLWPAQVGAVSAVPLPDGRTAVLFEGGERARREHILFGVLDAPAPAQPMAETKGAEAPATGTGTPAP